MRSEGIRSGPAGDGPSDRLRWNARYRRSAPDFTPHPLVAEAFAAGMVDGPVLELACGRSGSALALAEAGRRVVAVDVSDVALQQLATEAKRRGVAARVACVQADLETFVPPRGMFAFVLATRFWDAAVFDAAREAVSPGGLLGWEALALTDEDGSAVTSRFRVRHGTLGAALGPGWEVLLETATGETAGLRPHRSTRVLARALGR
ncbi:methyltransferase domain-containing protein [Saccharomonospora viridis]|jgi:SAM-dependent methyltransferase|uniref:methyltransferase domain-containing protein n=1 Tax=Saccharomonospora viridis TaxID=1852 RepID=UPI0023F1CAAC|nr:methyltransferase domain-containing protein [Saccharomonospora viridis]